MEAWDVSASLKKKLRKYYDYLWLNQKSRLSGAGLLHDSDVSATLKKQISIAAVKGNYPLRNLTILSDLSDDCLGALMLTMTHSVYMPGDYICRQHEPIHTILFSRKGEVYVFTEPDVKNCGVLCSSTILFNFDLYKDAPDKRFFLGKGNFFGEMVKFWLSLRLFFCRSSRVNASYLFHITGFPDGIRTHSQRQSAYFCGDGCAP